MKDKKFNMWVDSDELDHWKERADKENRTLSNWVRTKLMDHKPKKK